MLRPFAHLIACCCAKIETGQTFQPATPNISFVPWSPKRSATMLDPFAQLFQHCWGHARSFRVVYKDLWVVSFPRCTAGPNIVGSCCIRLHTPVNTHATIPNIVGIVGAFYDHCKYYHFDFLFPDKEYWNSHHHSTYQGLHVSDHYRRLQYCTSESFSDTLY